MAMNKWWLRELSGVSPNVIVKLVKVEPVAMKSLINIAETLKVALGDIVSIEGEEND